MASILSRSRFFLGLASVLVVLTFSASAGAVPQSTAPKSVQGNAPKPARAAVPSVPQDVLGALMNAAVNFQPMGEGLEGLPATSLQIAPAEWIEIAQAFTEVMQVIQKSGERRAAYLAKLKAQGIEEEPMSDAGVAFEINVLNNRFAFDKYGYLHFDDRFVKKEERPALQKVEALYRRFHKRWMAANAGKMPPAGKKQPTVKTGGKPTPGGAPGTKTETVSTPPGAIVDRAAEWRVRRVPIFRGFEDDRYQEHDALIVRCVDEFNRARADWAGATAAQGKKIPALTSALVKSHMIEETGGRDARSLAAWDVDPQQVNVPGDWSDAKSSLGLKKPSKRNEGTAEQNIRAAIRFLTRKGFGVSGQPASKRPTGSFDDWQTALKRYNGRSDEMVDGKSYSETYAEHIVARAKDPGQFVAIRKKVKK